MLRPATPEAYQLMHEGVQALSVLEQNGIRIDTRYVKRQIKKTERKMEKLKRRMRKTEEYKTWKKHYGEKMKMNASAQLGKVIFDIMGHERAESITKRGKNDESAFRYVESQFIKDYFRYKKLGNAKKKNLQGLLVECINGRAHVFFDLHTVSTYRGSSSRFNSQNIPVRDEELAELVRRAFIPDDDCYLVEIDFSGNEVRGAACYNKDPMLIKYLTDPTTDMHRDMAMECYLLNKEEVNKTSRYCAKNKFVFPEFYGSVYQKCAPALWEAIQMMKLTTESGTSLKKHLKKKGITELGKCDFDRDRKPKKGTFEHHIQQVEKRFWGERFKAYSKWKQRWYEDYLRNGYVMMKTGFVISGIHNKREIINYPIQGASFHILLKSLILLVNEVRNRKMKTKITTQIHDSIIASVPRKELQDYLSLAHEIMTKRMPKIWDWLIVHPEVEIGVSETNWHEKKEWVQKKGLWLPKAA